MVSTADEKGRKKKINGWEYKTTKITQSAKQRETNLKKKNEESLKALWVSDKRSNIHIIIVQKERTRRAGLKKYLKK